ncbi:MAG: hypothetical protein CL609_09285 [Anaerolineaceae bacterium]|nr:hypothetical protein [Anaerolineaceae bacterium]
MKKIVLIAGFVLLGIFLSGCGTMTLPVQPSIEVEPKELSTTVEYGQTFFSRENGLTAIDFYIVDVIQPGEVKLELYSIDNLDEPIVSTERNINLGVKNEFVRFDFNQNIFSLNQDYYLKLSVPGEAVIDIGNSYADVYSSGAMYENANPIERQMAFRLGFNRLQVVFGLLTTFLQWLLWLGFSILLFFIPGFALYKLFWSNNALSLGSIIGISFGIGAAIYPVLLLWMRVIGLQLHQWNIWIVIIPSLIFSVYSLIKTLKHTKKTFRFNQSFFVHEKKWFFLAYLIIVTAIVFTRFWVIRSIEVPMWGDSYQHTMIAQLILDHGGLFQSWLPYVPYETLTVQYGFPAASAVFAWISGESSIYSTLIVGQVFNILSILVLYPLGEKVTRKNNWGGNIVLILAGIFSMMPAMYVNWGRYAQLSGQVVLPILMWMMWELLEKREEFTWKKIFLTGLLLVGMSLNYYRTPFIFAFFAAAIILGLLIKNWKSRSFWYHILKVNLPIIFIAILFLLPWGTRLIGSNLSSALEAGVTREIPLQSVINDYQAWRAIKNYVYPVLLMFSILGFVLAGLKKNWNIWLIFLWTIFISVYKFTQIFNFPGANMMQSFAILIMLYIPVSILAGYFLTEVVNYIPRWKNLIVFVMIFIVLIPGVNTARKIVDEPFYAIVKRPDLRAMQWIKENTKSDSNFLIEGFRIYNGNSSVGSDGGWYIPLLTKRHNTIPPQYALLNEKPIDPNYTEMVTERIKMIEEAGLSSIIPEFCRGELTHLYIGQDHGLVGENNPKLFDEEDIDLEYFSLVYKEDRVRIYQFKDAMCGN